MFSLDAVAVALVWQIVLALGCCDRWPTVAESTVLALTVWLVYVADRLLDASMIRLDRPHTLRHGFHARHAKRFLVAWIVILVIDVSIALMFLSGVQTRVGLVASTLVTIYLAIVHFGKSARGIKSKMSQPSRFRWNGKELLIGIVFAFGVALPVWCDWLETHRVDLVSAVISVSLAAILFASNCWIVGALESSLDRTQNFSSLSNAMPDANRLIAYSSAWWLVVSLAAGLLGFVSVVPALCLAASFAVLLVMNRFATENAHFFRRVAPGLIADALIVMTPLSILFILR